MSSKRLESCEIRWWRGYRSAEFYAALAGSEEAAALSPSFRSRGSDPPDDSGQARAAYDALVAHLGAAGWEPNGTGEHWFSRRFHRPLADADFFEEIEETPAPEPEPVVETIEPAPAPPPPPAPVAKIPVEKPRPARSRNARERWIQVAALALLIFALVFLAKLVDNSRAPAPAPSKARAAAQPGAIPGSPTRVARASAVAAPRTARVEVRAASGDSWVEIRRGSAIGSSVYSGKLLEGQQVKVSGPRLWARLGAAANLNLKLNGATVERLHGTLDLLFTPQTARIV